jgi:hypothetical protein
MRFVAICTIFVAVLTLAIHGVLTSPVDIAKQAGQVDQGLSHLSKKKRKQHVLLKTVPNVSLLRKKNGYMPY